MNRFSEMVLDFRLREGMKLYTKKVRRIHLYMENGEGGEGI